MQKKKHILVLSQYFYPEPFRINDMCMEWIKRGYKVTVLTGIPNYPYGKFYQGYGYTKKRFERWNGIDIIRIPLIPRGNSSMGMVLNYLSFVGAGYIWKCFSKLKADFVFMFEVSPMTQTLVGVWYAKKHKIPCYLYVQDLWPDNVEIVTGIHSKLILGPIGKMVDYVYRNCNRIFATSESFVKEIVKRGVDEGKVKFWPQYAEEFYKPLKMERLEHKDKFIIAFTGNIGYAQGLDILPKVAEQLKQNEKKALFKIVGDGRYKDRFIQEIKDKDVLDMFEIIGRQPAENIPAILSQCDAAFVSFMDNPLFEKTIPAKLQSYMACGMPIVAAASGETEKIIAEAQNGVCCRIGDVDGLAAAIEDIMEWDMEKMRQASRTYFDVHFDKKKLMDQMEQYFP